MVRSFVVAAFSAVFAAVVVRGEVIDVTGEVRGNGGKKIGEMVFCILFLVSGRAHGTESG